MVDLPDVLLPEGQYGQLPACIYTASRSNGPLMQNDIIFLRGYLDMLTRSPIILGDLSDCVVG